MGHCNFECVVHVKTSVKGEATEKRAKSDTGDKVVVSATIITPELSQEDIFEKAACLAVNQFYEERREEREGDSGDEGDIYEDYTVASSFHAVPAPKDGVSAEDVLHHLTCAGDNYYAQDTRSASLGWLRSSAFAEPITEQELTRLVSACAPRSYSGVVIPKANKEGEEDLSFLVYFDYHE